jgi:hypothetical protein
MHFLFYISLCFHSATSYTKYSLSVRLTAEIFVGIIHFTMSATIPAHLLSVQVIWWKVQLMNAGFTRTLQVHYAKLNAVFREVLKMGA